MTDVDALLDEPDIPMESAGGPKRPSIVSRLTRNGVGTALQVAGAASVSVAAFGVDVLLGWLAAGVCLIVFGVATELGGR